MAKTGLIPEEELAGAHVNFWRGVILVTLVSWGVVLYQVYRVAQERGFLHTSHKWQMAFTGGLVVSVLGALLLAMTFTPLYTRVEAGLKTGFRLLRRLGLLNLLLFLACSGAFLYLLHGNKGYLVENSWARLGILWLLSLPAGVSLRAALAPAAGRAGHWLAHFLAAVIAIMAINKLAGFIPDISTSPLSLGWSEASRYYYASLFYAPRLYGQDLPWPFLHPSRYLLQSLPYLIPSLPLTAHRAWQVLLWIGLTALSAGGLVRRLRPQPRFLAWVVAVWAFLFLFQGPVYYHLLVCVNLVLWLFDPRRLWRSLIVVVVASLWAGISRINWFPVPAFLAVAIYLLDVPYEEARALWSYLRRPLLWGVVGLASAFLAQALYILASGNQDVSSFGSSFTSDLLWYRLWPSPTYPPGIFPMVAAITLPLLVVIVWFSLRYRFHPLRLVGLVGMTLVLFAGGLVVSTKIGGGSNLHNLDAYLVLVLLWGTSLLFGRFAAEPAVKPALSGAPEGRLLSLPWWLLLLAAIMPVYPLAGEGGMFPNRNTVGVWEDIRELQGRVDEVTARGGRVLFISQRQLLIFGTIQGVTLEPEYETVELMEMAMSNNTAYLDQFYRDLREHRFDLIVDGEENIIFKGPQDAFPEENNVWVERVAIPLLDAYQSSAVLQHSHIQLLVPKP